LVKMQLENVDILNAIVETNYTAPPWSIKCRQSRGGRDGRIDQARTTFCGTALPQLPTVLKSVVIG